MFVDGGSTRRSPYIHDNTIECHIADHLARSDAAHSDYWRVSTSGDLFIIRGYIEDSLSADRRAIQPVTVFDLTLPVWRIGECLLFIQRFAEEMGAGPSVVTVRCEWTGLRGRNLTVLSGTRMLVDDHTSRSNNWVSTITTQVDRISAGLPEIVRELLQPLYALFDFFQPPATIYSEELGRMQRREL